MLVLILLITLPIEFLALHEFINYQSHNLFHQNHLSPVSHHLSQQCLNIQIYNPLTQKCDKKIFLINQNAPRIIQPQPNFLQQKISQIKANTESRLLFQCLIQTPYVKDNVCIKCEPFFYFNLANQVCVKDCQNYYLYDHKLQMCVKATFLTSPQSPNIIVSVRSYSVFNTNTIEIFKSQPFSRYCPQTAPYLAFGSCISCPPQTPFFNVDLVKCENCSTGRSYSQVNHRCQSNISKDSLSISRMIMNII